MRIAGYDVTNITKTSARVGTYTLYLEEARRLVQRMESMKTSFVTDGYTPATPSGPEFANFTLQADNTGWLSPGTERRFGQYSTAGFCLHRENAKELLDFLTDYFERFPEPQP